MPAVKKYALLSVLARAALFDPPSDATAIVRHYTLSPEDLALIRQRRRSPNRLGFAVHLAYLRFPGRALGPSETPPAELVAFIARQLGLAPGVFDDLRAARKPAGNTWASCRRTWTFALSGAGTFVRWRR